MRSRRTVSISLFFVDPSNVLVDINSFRANGHGVCAGGVRRLGAILLHRRQAGEIAKILLPHRCASEVKVRRNAHSPRPLTRCRNGLPALTGGRKSAGGRVRVRFPGEKVRVTSLVPPCDCAHRTARYGTINLLWLFGYSQQNARAARPAGVSSTAATNPL